MHLEYDVVNCSLKLDFDQQNAMHKNSTKFQNAITYECTEYNYIVIYGELWQNIAINWQPETANVNKNKSANILRVFFRSILFYIPRVIY